ncbi:peptide ABC transporter permease, partial [Vibrio sp. S457-15]
IIPRAMPGAPVTMMYENDSVQVTSYLITAMTELLGFVDGPIYIQSLSFIKIILSWELGTSIQFYPLSVNSLLGSAFGWSLFLAGTAVVPSFSIASVLGIFAAWKRGSRYDAFVTPGTMIIQAIPQMVIA